MQMNAKVMLASSRGLFLSPSHALLIPSFVMLILNLEVPDCPSGFLEAWWMSFR